MEEYEELCKKCNGKGYIDPCNGCNSYFSYDKCEKCKYYTFEITNCDICKGTGKIVWIDKIMKGDNKGIIK